MSLQVEIDRRRELRGHKAIRDTTGVEGGGSGYGVTLSHRAAADPDLQCRQLYVEMLNQEFQTYHGLTMNMLARSLHRESDDALFKKKVDLILEYSCIDRDEYLKQLQQSSREDAIAWLLDQIELLKQNREKN